MSERYVRYRPRHEVKTPLVRLFRLMLLLGVWVLVGLAGLVVGARLIA